MERVGHSAVVHGDLMIIFAGKDNDNNKLNDIWEYNFIHNIWKEYQIKEGIPIGRSGHSACIYRDYMIVFGGIHEVTKELDDMVLFDFVNKRWIQFFEEGASPNKRRLSISNAYIVNNS